MQTTVNVSSKILTWVVSHVQPAALPSDVLSHIDLWINGDKKPTFNQIEKLSAITGIPLGYFFLQTPPEEDLSLIEYRTIDSIELKNPSRNLIDTLHEMDQVQEWMRNALISNGASPLAFIGSQKGEDSIDLFAKFIRELLCIEVEWYKTCSSAEESFNALRTSISNVGVITMMSGIVGSNTHRSLDINEFRAFSVVDEYAPLIFINSNDSDNGKLFSLLHEFSHICIGENSLFNDRYSFGNTIKAVETRCNAVAAEILVPQSVFVREWASGFTAEKDVDKTVELLARTFKCGITVIARKAFDNGFIDYRKYQKIAKHAVQLYNDSRKAKKEKGNSGGDYYRTIAKRIDQRFFTMLVSSVYEGKTLYSDAFRLTNTNRSTFSNLVNSIGGGLR